MLRLDEISQADPVTVTTSIYDLMNGKQKIRADKTGRVRKNMSWHLLVLSSGEESLRDIAENQKRKLKAGEEIRLADIPADAGLNLGVNETLPSGYSSIQEYSYHMKNAVHQYYGTAFKEWLAVLASHKHEDIPERLADQITAFVNEVAPNSTSQVKRMAEAFGLLAVSGELVSEHGIKNLVTDVPKKSKKLFVMI